MTITTHQRPSTAAYLKAFDKIRAAQQAEGKPFIHSTLRHHLVTVAIRHTFRQARRRVG